MLGHRTGMLEDPGMSHAWTSTGEQMCDDGQAYFLGRSPLLQTGSADFMSCSRNLTGIPWFFRDPEAHEADVSFLKGHHVMDYSVLAAWTGGLLKDVSLGCQRLKYMYITMENHHVQSEITIFNGKIMENQSMAIFNSYVSLPEGIFHHFPAQKWKDDHG